MSKGLILALDVEPESAKSLIRDFKDTIDIFKIGNRLFTALGPSLIEWAHECGCKVFLDLKFHDIPLTVAESCRNAVRMKVWGLTIHSSGGFGMMKEAVRAVSLESKTLGISRPLIFGVTVLTSFSQSDLKSIGISASPLSQVKRLSALAKKSGLDGVVYFFTQVIKVKKTDTCDKLTLPVVAVMADGDYVTVLTPRTYDDPRTPGKKYDTSWFDTWRFVDGKADEHWDPDRIRMPQ